MRTEAVLALDVGGGHVTAGMVRRTDDLSGRSVVGEVVRRSIPPDSSGPELLTAWAACAMDAVASQSVAAVGIAVPAPFDYDRGVSRAVHKFASLSGVDVGAGLAQRWSRSPMADAPVVFGNDADLWTLGEAVAGEARGFRRIIGLTLGTGLGSGFVVEGRIVRSGAEVPPDGELWNVRFGDGIRRPCVWAGRRDGLPPTDRLRTGRYGHRCGCTVGGRCRERCAGRAWRRLGRTCRSLGAVVLG